MVGPRALPLLLLVAGCDVDKAGSDAGPAVMALQDENNYTYSASVDLALVEVGALADADVDWSRITTDLQGHAIDPVEDVDEVYFTRFADELGETDVESRIAEGTLLQRDIVAMFLFENAEGRTAIRLSDLDLFGSEFIPEDYLMEGEGLWAFSLATEGQPSARVSTFVLPLEASDNHRIEIDDDSGSLDFSADLTSIEPVVVTAGRPLTFDWSGLTRNGLGTDIDFRRMDELLLGRYEDLTVGDLETGILDLELLATDRYSLAVGTDTAADPALATSEDGDPFPGFDVGALWLLVLRCNGPSCTNPAPQFLTVLDVVSGS